MRYHYPAADRNAEPILEMLRKTLPSGDPASSIRVLEIASGSGQHALYFSSRLPGVLWQPSDLSEESLASIRDYRTEGDPARFLEPIRLDAAKPPWNAGEFDAILCCNMIHISPWLSTEGLFGGGAKSLKPGAVLITYGPYRFSGVFTADSNREFDEDLKRRNPEWGVRDVDDLERLAQSVGFSLERTHSLPANNHALIWRLRR